MVQMTSFILPAFMFLPDSNDEEVRVFELTTMEAEQCKKVMNENDIVLESTEASICAIADSDANQVNSCTIKNQIT